MSSKILKIPEFNLPMVESWLGLGWFRTGFTIFTILSEVSSFFTLIMVLSFDEIDANWLQIIRIRVALLRYSMGV